MMGSDLITVALLVVLEGLLSADNAMVLAVLVLSLPKEQQQKALQPGTRLGIDDDAIGHQFEVSESTICDGAEKSLTHWAHQHRKRRWVLDGTQDLRPSEKNGSAVRDTNSFVNEK